ncbi:hypothetical protein GCM10023183_30220 [Nibribacter koreensis]|uniref:Uncharacterized protein n=2 Tax=Nibribacter koreensis TaxID=1084519 RepID=A0ABP8FUW7_9BACT
MLVIAIANGAGREWYKQHTGEITGRQISTITLLIFFGLYIYWVVHKFPLKSDASAMLVGALWLILTLAFEFGFGLYSGHSLKELLAEYNIMEGKLWILVPVWVAIAPYLLKRV